MTDVRRCILMIVTLCGFARAQAEVPAATAVPPRTLTIQNLAPTQREEWISVTVPFAEGAVSTEPNLHAEDCATVWQPFGARWPDGSWRHAFCMFRRKLGPVSETAVELVPGPGPALPEDLAFRLGPHQIQFVVTIDGKVSTAEPEIVELIESNAARHVVLMRCRIGETGLVGEFTLEACTRVKNTRYCGVAVFFSDPTTPDMERRVDEIAVVSKGLALCLRHAQPFAIRATPTKDGSRVVLLSKNVLGDGQGLRRTGVLVPPLSGGEDPVRDDTLFAAIYCKPLGATSWRGTGAFGVFGYVPEPPPWLGPGRLRRAFADRHRAFVEWSRAHPGNPFLVGRHGPASATGVAGDQPDFGVVQLEPVASTGIPSFLHEVELSVLQEGCRAAT